MNICIYGASSPLIDKKYTDAAFELCADLAKAGHKLIFGGGGDGMMGAAARGFQSEGGGITGILPRFFNDKGDTENLYDNCDNVIYTADIPERISLMKTMSDAFLVLPGGTGTYEEFFSTLVSGYLGQHEKKLVLFNAYGYYDKLLEMLKDGWEKKFITDATMERFQVFDEKQAKELVAYFEDHEHTI